ncbi:MAG: hypothetical protein AAB426_08735 [Myxococcota bacterium]
MATTQGAMTASELERSSDEMRDSFAFAMQSGRRLLERLRVIDFKSYEPLSPEAATSLMLCGAAKQVQQSMRDVASLLATMPALLSDGPMPPEGIVEEHEPIWNLEDAEATEGEAAPVHDRFCEELDAALEGLTNSAAGKVLFEAFDNSCQMLVLELRRARARLMDAQRRRVKWAMITEGEESRRKATKALQAGVALAARMLDVDLHGTEFAEQPSELHTSLAVRNLVFELRANVESITAGIERLPVNELALRVRDARILLLELFASPLYHSLRAPDRYGLQQLRQRAAEWLESLWEDGDAARHVLDDLRLFVDLLVQINCRDVLVQHDRRLVQASRESLTDLLATTALSRTSPWSAYAAVLAELQRARWRDETLDGVVARELRRGESELADLGPRIEATLEALSHVRF